MRFIFYLFIFSQLLNFVSLFADQDTKDSSKLKQIKWQKIQENNSNNLKKIIWKSYKDDESYFKKKIKESSVIKKLKNIREENNYKYQRKSLRSIVEIEPYLPLNNFLDYGDFQTSVKWKSAFSGGAAGGTGNQNYAIKFDYGLSDDSLLSIYLSEADDPLYKLIDGEIIPNNWASVALSYKKKIFESGNLKNSFSFANSLEYWVISSGSDDKKSIYNEIDNAVGLDRYEKFIYSFSIPFSRALNNKTKISIAPGATFIPDTLGNKNIGKNFYGNNYFLASAFNFDFSTNVQLIGSYTFIFGPGNNSFDENLLFERKSIYSYGFNWDVNPIIGIEGKITNGFGSTPATSLLTIPSANKPLYYIGGNYRAFENDTKFFPLERENKLLLFGGLTVENALFPERGESQVSFNYDEKGNLFAFYGYSLSNIFQIELRSGSFNDVDLNNSKSSTLQNTFLNENTFNYRFGGKLLILSPQKNDLFWMTLRTSVGRNEGLNHKGYIFTELINTFRLNERIAFNISPKYFFSGVESFGGLGVSTYINLFDNLQFIPEINTSLKNDSDSNSTLALRYSYSPRTSADLYYSNASGIQDIGQFLKDKKFRIGIKLNFLY